MSFKSLLVPVQPASACNEALPHVVEFAQSLSADLTGVASLASIFIANPWIVSGDIVQQLTDDQEGELKAAEERFHIASRALNVHRLRNGTPPVRRHRVELKGEPGGLLGSLSAPIGTPSVS